jgi:cytoskeletal protein CcmA (bactofilin family)
VIGDGILLAQQVQVTQQGEADHMWKRDQSVMPTSTPPKREAPAAVASTQPIVPAPSAPAGKSAENVIMDLGTSVAIKGELSASEDLTLCGRMEGSIRLPDHTLTIGPNAEVKAEIVAKSVVILGSVTGNLTATERVDIRATGSLIGDLTSPRLAIAEGGSLRGKVQMSTSASSTASHSNAPRKVEAVG